MRADTQHTDRLTDDKGCTRQLKTKMVFFLLLYRCHFNISTVPGHWPKVAHYAPAHYICKLSEVPTVTSLVRLSQPGAPRTAKLSRLNIFSSPSPCRFDHSMSGVNVKSMYQRVRDTLLILGPLQSRIHTSTSLKWQGARCW